MKDSVKYSSTQSASCDFRPRLCQRLGGGGALLTGSGEGRSEVLVNYAPVTINMYAIVGNEPATRQNSVALRTEIVGLEANGRAPRRPRLQKILVGHACVVQRGKKLRSIHLGSRERIFESQRKRR